MVQLKLGESDLNFTGILRTKATEKHYHFLIRRYAEFRKTLDLDKIIKENSQNPRLAAAAHIRHFQRFKQPSNYHLAQYTTILYLLEKMIDWLIINYNI